MKEKTSETAEALQTAWLKELEKIFEETVGQMWLEWVNKWANYLTIDNADNIDNWVGISVLILVCNVTGRHWISIVRRSFSSLQHCILFLLNNELKIISYQFEALMTFSLKLKLDIFLTAQSGSTPFLLQIGYLAQKLATAVNFT